MKSLEALLADGVTTGLYTQGVLAVQQGANRQVATVGRPTLDVNTRFDLASLTKICGPLMGILRLLDSGQLQLSTSLADIFPELPLAPWAQVTIERLLTHTSGLVSSVKFYQAPQRVSLFAALAQVLPRDSAEVVYSDLNFMWLGLVIEAVANTSLAHALSRGVFGPLGMQATSFDPREAIATRVQGKPDDHNAAYFGVPVGHAGLFSSAADLLRFGQFWLHPQPGVIAAPWLAQSVTRQTEAPAARGYGWVLNADPSAFFTAFGQGSYGHTGYTGTSLMLDPKRDLVVVLLTNRTACGVGDGFVRYRRVLHERLARIIIERE